MELLKKALRYQRTVALETVYREESADCIVPDSQPDIDRILDVHAFALLRDREAGQNEVKLRCTVRASVLYAAENDGQVHTLDVPLSFTHTLPMRGVQPRDELLCAVRACMADARVINSRKLAVRTTTAMRVRACREDEEQIVCGALEEGLCTRTEKRTLSRVRAVGVRSFTLVEDVELGQDAPNAQSVLFARLSIEPQETKLLAGRASVRALARCEAVYKDPEGNLCTLEKSFPFTQSADMAVGDGENTLEADFTLRSFELECAVDMSGESRYLSLSAGVTMYLSAAETEEAELLQDMYGLKRGVSFSCRTLSLQPPGEAACAKIHVSESLETAQQAQKVIYARVVPDLSAERADAETLTSSAMLSLVYQAADGGLYGASRRIELRFPAQGMDAADARISVGPVGAACAADSLRIDFDALAEGRAGAGEGISMIEEAEWGEAYAPDPRALSAILLRVPGGESVWEIAKRYHTTAAAIEKANGDAGEISSGSLLLIPL